MEDVVTKEKQAEHLHERRGFRALEIVLPEKVRKEEERRSEDRARKHLRRERVREGGLEFAVLLGDREFRKVVLERLGQSEVVVRPYEGDEADDAVKHAYLLDRKVGGEDHFRGVPNRSDNKREEVYPKPLPDEFLFQALVVFQHAFRVNIPMISSREKSLIIR